MVLSTSGDTNCENPEKSVFSDSSGHTFLALSTVKCKRENLSPVLFFAARLGGETYLHFFEFGDFRIFGQTTGKKARKVRRGTQERVQNLQISKSVAQS